MVVSTNAQLLYWSCEHQRAGTNLVLLDPDITQAFANNAEAINEALRLVFQLTKLPTNR